MSSIRSLHWMTCGFMQYAILHLSFFSQNTSEKCILYKDKCICIWNFIWWGILLVSCTIETRCFSFAHFSISFSQFDLTWSWVYFSTAAGVPRTGVGSRWLECLTPNPHASLFSGSMLPRLHIFMSVLTVLIWFLHSGMILHIICAPLTHLI